MKKTIRSGEQKSIQTENPPGGFQSNENKKIIENFYKKDLIVDNVTVGANQLSNKATLIEQSEFLEQIIRRLSVQEFKFYLEKSKFSSNLLFLLSKHFPFHQIVKAQRPDLISELLKHNFDINAFDNTKPFPLTPLWITCANNNIGIATELLQYGANPTIECGNLLPIQVVPLSNCEEFFALFEKYRMPRTAKNSSKQTLLHLKIISNERDYVIKLMEMNFDNFDVDIYGKTPFEYTLLPGREQIFDYMLTNYPHQIPMLTPEKLKTIPTEKQQKILKTSLTITVLRFNPPAHQDIENLVL